ncbi:MAG: hypothetical protein MZV65_12845 [Chromatiales bacterium]|nr:hypothetical protein [Chromatiales bacterium]
MPLTLGLLGEIRWSWLPALLAGSLAGGYLGAHFAIAKGNLWIKRAFEPGDGAGRPQAALLK